MKKENIIFILDQSQMANNVAQAARAMANFGFRELRLVAPLNLPSAERMARGGAEVVRQARQFETLAEALADLTWVLGTSGKENIGREEAVRPEIACSELATLSDSDKVGLVFGCENHGLTKSELRTLDRLAHIPTDPECKSVNLAQSVTLFAWELDKIQQGPAQPLDLGLPTHQKKQQLYIKIDDVFASIGLIPDGRKETLKDGVRQFFNRQALNNKDLSYLLRVLNLFQKHLDAVREAKP